MFLTLPQSLDSAFLPIVTFNISLSGPPRQGSSARTGERGGVERRTVRGKVKDSQDRARGLTDLSYSALYFDLKCEV